MKKRIVGMLLLLAIFFSLSPPAFAADEGKIRIATENGDLTVDVEPKEGIIIDLDLDAFNPSEHFYPVGLEVAVFKQGESDPVTGSLVRLNASKGKISFGDLLNYEEDVLYTVKYKGIYRQLGENTSHYEYKTPEWVESRTFFKRLVGSIVDIVRDDVKWDLNMGKFLVVIADEEKPEFEKGHKRYYEFIKELDYFDVTFFGVGKENTNKSQIESLISDTNNRGAFISKESPDVDASLNVLADKIVELMKKDLTEEEITVLLDEEFNFSTNYFDEEGDPLFVEKEGTPDEIRHERYGINHEPGYYENANGYHPRHDKMSNETFNVVKQDEVGEKVGRYQLKYEARDNPFLDDLTKDVESGFDLYRKWSNTADNAYVNVHRKPTADFSVYQLENENELIYIDRSFDLDAYSQGERGIRKKLWRHRLLEGDWVNGKPTTMESGFYEIELIVEDFQGAFDMHREIVEVVLELPNHPPEPGFDFVQVEKGREHYYRGEPINIFTRAWDPDEDDIHVWYETVYPDGTVVNSRTNDTYYEMFSYPYCAEDKEDTCYYNFNPAGSVLPLGTYKVTQHVVDEHGETAEITRDFDIVNRPPVAGFNYLNEPYYVGDEITVHVDQTTDPDNDPLNMAFALYYYDGSGGYTLIERQTFDAVENPYDFTFTFDTQIPDYAHEGIFEVIQTVTDGLSDPVQYVRLVTVKDLEIIGDVLHTPMWKKHHEEVRGCDFSTDCRYDFYAGEKFLLEALVTDKEVTSVDVEMRATRITGENYIGKATLFDTGEVDEEYRKFDGELYEESMIDPTERLANGPATFTFVVNYESGIRRQDQVTVNIIGDTISIIDFHKKY